MSLFYVEKGAGMPTGVSDLKIGDIVKVKYVSEKYSYNYMIMGFCDDGEEIDTLLTAVGSNYVSTDKSGGFRISRESDIGGWDYNVYASEDILGYVGTEKRFMYWESVNLEVVEEYSSDFWKL
ncbi:MAG: hypothetical protein ACRCX2_12300 [Paraclostridium sp.]